MFHLARYSYHPPMFALRMSVQWESPWALGVTDGGMAPTTWFYLNDQPTISALRTHIPQGVLYASLIGVRSLIILITPGWHHPNRPKNQQVLQQGNTITIDKSSLVELKSFASSFSLYSATCGDTVCVTSWGQRSAIVLDDLMYLLLSQALPCKLITVVPKKSQQDLNVKCWLSLQSIWLICGHIFGTSWIWSINQSFQCTFYSFLNHEFNSSQLLHHLVDFFQSWMPYMNLRNFHSKAPLKYPNPLKLRWHHPLKLDKLEDHPLKLDKLEDHPLKLDKLEDHPLKLDKLEDETDTFSFWLGIVFFVEKKHGLLFKWALKMLPCSFQGG